MITNIDSFQYEIFIKIFPEFTDVPEASVFFVGDFCFEFLPKHVWGKWHTQACFLLIAHKLARRYPVDFNKAGVNNQTDMLSVTSKSASTGSLSESGNLVYTTQSDSPFISELSNTIYGIEFLSLIELIMPMSQVVYSKPSWLGNWTDYSRLVI